MERQVKVFEINRKINLEQYETFKQMLTIIRKHIELRCKSCGGLYPIVNFKTSRIYADSAETGIVYIKDIAKCCNKEYTFELNLFDYVEGIHENVLD